MTEAEIKSAYSDYLRTPDGVIGLKNAIEVKKGSCDEDLLFFNADNVKFDNIPKKITDKMKLIEITPLLVNNNCHSNADFMKRFGYKSVIGYGIVSCSCGKTTFFETHSVNEKDGLYYDFTRSAVSIEKKRWFYPIEENSFRKFTFNYCYKRNLHPRDVNMKEFLIVNRGCCCDRLVNTMNEKYRKNFTSFKPIIKHQLFPANY